MQDIYDFSGNVTRRIWRSANGTTNRSQTLSWDARGRLFKVVERDNQTNGFDWTPVYDPLGRKLRTVEIPVTNGVSLTAQSLVIEQYFDPQVRFMAMGVSVAGKTTWKIMGPDINGRYGGLQGRGGFDAIIPGPELFCPTIADARGNILGVYDVTHESLMWNQSRPTGYGAAPAYRPPPLGRGADLIQASAFAGIWSDVTGYYWRGNRHYDPIAGRWLSGDPLGHDSDVSLFSYANGDPINFDDPDGLYGRKAFNAMKGLFEAYGEAETHRIQNTTGGSFQSGYVLAQNGEVIYDRARAMGEGPLGAAYESGAYQVGSLTGYTPFYEGVSEYDIAGAYPIENGEDKWSRIVLGGAGIVGTGLTGQGVVSAGAARLNASINATLDDLLNVNFNLAGADGPGGTVMPQVLINQANGASAEALIAQQLLSEGNTILGTHVGARTSDGLRIIDRLVQNPAGQYLAVEIKSGEAVRNAQQLLRDGLMATEGATLVGRNAPPNLRGQQLVIPTIERR